MIVRPDSKLVADVHPSPNFGERKGGAVPSILLLHYTGVASAQLAIAWLANRQSQVSCHYVVDEDGRITQMVAEGMRAWHAGLGAWAGDTDINSSSIGIEIQNVGHEAGYPDFPASQMAAVTRLAQDILARHRIRAERVLAHSDVAPQRKIDPGEKFPWDALAAQGVGHWVAPLALDPADPGVQLGASSPFVSEMQALLLNYGYAVRPTGCLDTATEFVIKAFQRHFRPARVDGRLDHSTFATLQALSAALPGEPMMA